MKNFLTTTAFAALLIAGVSGVASAQVPAPATTNGHAASEAVKSVEPSVKAGETAVKEEVKDAKGDVSDATEVGKDEAKKDGKAVKAETKATKKTIAPVTTTPAK